MVNTSKEKDIDVAEILGFFLFRVIFGLLTDQKNGPSPQYRVLCEMIFQSLMLYAKKAIFNAKTMDIKQIQDFCPKFHGSMPT